MEIKLSCRAERPSTSPLTRPPRLLSLPFFYRLFFYFMSFILFLCLKNHCRFAGRRTRTQSVENSGCSLFFQIKDVSKVYKVLYILVSRLYKDFDGDVYKENSISGRSSAVCPHGWTVRISNQIPQSSSSWLCWSSAVASRLVWHTAERLREMTRILLI